jgi:hypothetical protein
MENRTEILVNRPAFLGPMAPGEKQDQDDPYAYIDPREMGSRVIHERPPHRASKEMLHASGMRTIQDQIEGMSPIEDPNNAASERRHSAPMQVGHDHRRDLKDYFRKLSVPADQSEDTPILDRLDFASKAEYDEWLRSREELLALKYIPPTGRPSSHFGRRHSAFGFPTVHPEPTVAPTLPRHSIPGPAKNYPPPIHTRSVEQQNTSLNDWSSIQPASAPPTSADILYTVTLPSDVLASYEQTLDLLVALVRRSILPDHSYVACLNFIDDWIVLSRVPSWNDVERRDSLIGLIVRYLTPGEALEGLEKVEQRISSDVFAELCTLCSRLAQLPPASLSTLLQQARQQQPRLFLMQTPPQAASPSPSIYQEDERDMDEDDIQHQLLSTMGGISYDTEVGEDDMSDTDLTDKPSFVIDPTTLTHIIDDDDTVE